MGQGAVISTTPLSYKTDHAEAIAEVERLQLELGAAERKIKELQEENEELKYYDYDGPPSEGPHKWEELFRRLELKTYEENFKYEVYQAMQKTEDEIFPPEIICPICGGSAVRENNPQATMCDGKERLVWWYYRCRGGCGKWGWRNNFGLWEKQKDFEDQ